MSKYTFEPLNKKRIYFFESGFVFLIYSPIKKDPQVKRIIDYSVVFQSRQFVLVTWV